MHGMSNLLLLQNGSAQQQHACAVPSLPALHQAALTLTLHPTLHVLPQDPADPDQLVLSLARAVVDHERAALELSRLDAVEQVVLNRAAGQSHARWVAWDDACSGWLWCMKRMDMARGLGSGQYTPCIAWGTGSARQLQGRTEVVAAVAFHSTPRLHLHLCWSWLSIISAFCIVIVEQQTAVR